MSLAMEIEEDDIVKISGEGFVFSSDLPLKKLNEQFSKKQIRDNLASITSTTWQGVILKERLSDKTLAKGCFDWLSRWKMCPTYVIGEVVNLMYQTIQTKTFLSIRSMNIYDDTLCRICKNGNESVKHIMSNCEILAKKEYFIRHDSVLKCFVYPLLNVII